MKEAPAACTLLFSIAILHKSFNSLYISSLKVSFSTAEPASTIKSGSHILKRVFHYLIIILTIPYHAQMLLYFKTALNPCLCLICGYMLNPSGQRLLRSECGELRSPRTLPDEVLLIKKDGTGELLNVADRCSMLMKPP